MATVKPPVQGPLVDTTGQAIRLGAEIGHGGEGNVYEIAGAPDVLAKLYTKTPDAERAAKLAALPRVASPALMEVAAWPTGTLHPRIGAPPVGLLMPRANGVPIHRLYSPVSRKTEFPSFDWHKLVIVAHNVAAAMARLHAAGHVIGDVNQGNLLIGQQGIVRLIDCDSFQIRDGQRWFPCEVGVAHFTPPELQGRSFAGITRTPNHDAFGLAVLVFHLLFMGRHPFAGRYAGKGDMPLEQAIAEFRFAFGRHAGTAQMAPPPHALPLAGTSPGVAELFERAFGRDGVRDGGRPSAAEWKAALATLGKDLATCATSPGHKYPPTLAACPWCAIAQGGGPDFFASVLVAVHHLSGFNAVEVWSAILGVPAPEAALALPTPPNMLAVPSKPVQRWRRVAWRSQAPVAFAAGLALLAGTTGPMGAPALATAFGLFLLFLGLRRGSGLPAERARRGRELEAANARLRGIEERWTRELSGARERFRSKRRELEILRAEYHDLDAAKSRGRQELDAKRREHQLHQYLESHFIDGGGVPGIGAGRARTLASYGIETAADVNYTSVIAVPGFGPTRARALVSWRQLIERTFLFDPSKGVDLAELRAFETRLARRRDEIERALAAGPAALRQLSDAARQVHANLTRELSEQQALVTAASANVLAAT